MIDLKELLVRYHAERGGSVGETADGVRELSRMFNGITPPRPGYLAQQNLRRAYVHYYLTINAEKVGRVLDEMRHYAPPRRRPRVLDFGCGPGTASIALLLRRKARELWLVDTVDEALDDAAYLVRHLGVEPRTAHDVPPGEKFDLILAANVFSETWPPLEEHLTDKGYLVVVEPALRERTRRLMEWRDGKVAEGWKVAAPCLGEPKCPMLEHPDLWCHQDLPWPRPAAIAEVDRRVGLVKETLKYSYMVLTRKGRTLADLPGDARVVSNVHHEKGKVWAWVCRREGPLCRAEVLSRHRSPATAAFFHAGRGDVLKLPVCGAFARTEGPIEHVR